MLETYIQKIIIKEQLSCDEGEKVMNLILNNADPYQIAALLMLMKFKGETAEEVAGMAKALQNQSMKVHLQFPVLDIVGTGGDGANTVNISTGSAILAAASGIPVAKHGNRSVSSQSGSADVLEALGISIDLEQHQIEECLKTNNIAFLFAQKYNPCLKKLSPIRRGLKLPTVCNLLGPLLNPCQAEYLLIGVSSNHALELLSEVILQLPKIKRAIVFHSCGLDELTPLGIAQAYEIRNGERNKLILDPQVFGFKPCKLQDLTGGNAAMNAGILKGVFAGHSGAIADSLIYTAGVALYIFDKAKTIMDGIDIARAALRASKAHKLLERWISFNKNISSGSL